MKGLVMAGLLLAAPLYGFSQQGTHTNVQVQNTLTDIQQGGFDFGGLQQLLQDLQSLFENGNISVGVGDMSNPQSPQDINQQMNKILQDMNQLNQQMVAENIGHRIGLRHLPHQSATKQGAVSAGPVQIAAGDRRISAAVLQKAQQDIQNISLPLLQQNLGKQPAKGTQIVLFSSRQAYANALLQAGVSQQEIQAVVTNTGGLTIGNDVWIPLYNLQDASDLTNVLTHELTHVVFNQEGIGDNLPTWINEGTAWHDGMAAQSQVSESTAAQEAASLNDQIQQAAEEGQLLPLSASEDQILSANYNVEWVDYLAVEKLIKTYGEDKYRAFLENIPSQGVDAAFRAEFGQSRTSFENSFYQSL